jgi:hypothetical protein
VVWELFFMLVVLKIPVVYLCLVVWWAIRAEPEPPQGALAFSSGSPEPPECDWRVRRARLRRRGPLPRGGNRVRSRRRVALARARLRP